MKPPCLTLWAVAGLLTLALFGSGQVTAHGSSQSMPSANHLYQSMRYRLVGPFRGGRANTVVGLAGERNTYYFGAAGGGVWKTTNAGTTWQPIFDGLGVAAVGSLAVAPSDPNTLYVGTGDSRLRNNVSHGDGVYKSTDAGHTWRHLGLSDTRHIARVIVHPSNPNVALVAALGHVFGSNDQRGVFRTRDGGDHWERVLYIDEGTGAADVAFDPKDPNHLLASTWQALRTPHSFSSGGPGSGLHESTDGGSTWRRLEGRGLPEGVLGKIGVAFSPAQPNRVYALVEAERAGLYRSDDRGATWTLVNESHTLTQRAWFFMQVVPDPRDPETVYVLNINLLRSTDGGRSFSVIQQPHVDNQALWIDPGDSMRMINGNDGGANVTVDGGRTWTRSDNNQPTGQFYHVATDGRFPYRLYGGQQDFNTIVIASRSDEAGITERDWHGLSDCEMGFAVPDPTDPDVAYGGCTDGGIERYTHRTRRTQSIEPWPETFIGSGAGSARFRFQWTAPIMISPHDPRKLYHAANVLFRSTDQGMSWTVVSHDLTRNDPATQQSSGGPITKDNVGGEYYGTIFALSESPVTPDLIWAGSDDGLIHVTSNGGDTWQNVTPREMPEWSRISLIDPSPHDPAKAYVAVDRHMLDDYVPYVYKTTDSGRTWSRISTGIPEGSFVRAVREDLVRPGLLFAGTERGVYVSLDDGGEWQSLQLNLPAAPVHDLVVEGNDLVVATHGRGFWILDDLAPLRQLSTEVTAAAAYLFAPSPAYRLRADFTSLGNPAGENPPEGSIIYYFLSHPPAHGVTLSILDQEGTLVREFASGSPPDRDTHPFESWSPPTADPGLNRFVWDLRYPGPRLIQRHVWFWHPPLAPVVGTLAVPGTYRVILKTDEVELAAPLQLRPDPRLPVDPTGWQAQFALHTKLNDGLSVVMDALRRIRHVRTTLLDLAASASAHPQGQALGREAQLLAQRLDAIEQALTEPRMQVPGDGFNYPLRLDNKLAALIGVVANSDTTPTGPSYQLQEDLWHRIQDQLDELNTILDTALPALGDRAQEQGLPRIETGESTAFTLPR